MTRIKLQENIKVRDPIVTTEQLGVKLLKPLKWLGPLIQCTKIKSFFQLNISSNQIFLFR